jgi:hypothetical protein
MRNALHHIHTQHISNATVLELIHTEDGREQLSSTAADSKRTDK